MYRNAFWSQEFKILITFSIISKQAPGEKAKKKKIEKIVERNDSENVLVKDVMSISKHSCILLNTVTQAGPDV